MAFRESFSNSERMLYILQAGDSATDALNWAFVLELKPALRFNSSHELL
jgi:hypothetical protein